MKIILNQTIKHAGKTYEAGEHEVDDALGQYFMSVGWASNEEGKSGPPGSETVRLQPEDSVISQETETS